MFEQIAEIIANSHGRFEEIGRDYYKGGRLDAAEYIAEKLADLFVMEFPNFERSVFIETCKNK